MAERPTDGSMIDYRLLFEATASAFLVLDRDLVVVDVNPAYCTLLGRSRDELVGRHVDSLFPDNPGDPGADGLKAARTSLEAVRDTGRPHTLPLQRYDIADATTGVYVERYWSIVNTPVLDEHGATVLVLNRVEDVSDYVRERRDQRLDTDAAERGDQEVYVRSREVQAAWAAQARASRRAAALAGVAVAMAGAQTVPQVTELVIERGLGALDAGGGAVAVLKDARTLRLTTTGSLGERTVATWSELPRSGPLPASVAAATGRPVLLPDGAAARAFAPEMAAVLADTGCQAWAALPLRGRGDVLGSLTVGWVEPHDFPPEEVELLAAFALQCADGIERIAAREAERASAAAARGMAEVLQTSLLTEPVQPEHLQIAVRYHPAATGAKIGGDWYDAFLDPGHELNLVIGDIAGHDRLAAAAMGQTRNLLRGLTFGLRDSPAADLGALDRAMRHFAVGTLATVILAQVAQTPTDAATGARRVRWSNAGHPPPLLLTPDGSTTLLDAPPDVLLGVVPDTRRADHEALLPVGSTLVLYTDGLVERRGESLDDGLDRLVAVAGELVRVDLEALCDGLIERMDWDGDDDVALLALRVLPAGRP